MRVIGGRGAKDTIGKHRESTDLGPWGLIEIELPTRELAQDSLDSLHMCFSYVA